MTKTLGILTLILLILTIGCGFAITYGGEAFRNGIKGHMVLGVLTLISMTALLVSLFK